MSFDGQLTTYSAIIYMYISYVASHVEPRSSHQARATVVLEKNVAHSEPQRSPSRTKEIAFGSKHFRF